MPRQQIGMEASNLLEELVKLERDACCPTLPCPKRNGNFV